MLSTLLHSCQLTAAAAAAMAAPQCRRWGPSHTLCSDYHTMPVSKLFIGLGLICGAAGYVAVGKLGGSRPVWLAAWQSWVTLHIAFSAAAHRMQRISLRASQRPMAGSLAAGGAAASAAAVEAAAGMYEEAGGWLPVAMWGLLGVALPLLAGTLPFRR